MASTSQSYMSTTTPPEYTDEDAKALFTPTNPLPKGSIVPLPLPLCIPQVAPQMEQPFTRAYSPGLAASGITMDDWLKFTDGLVSCSLFHDAHIISCS